MRIAKLWTGSCRRRRSRRRGGCLPTYVSGRCAREVRALLKRLPRVVAVAIQVGNPNMIGHTLNALWPEAITPKKSSAESLTIALRTSTIPSTTPGTRSKKLEFIVTGNGGR